MGLIKHNCYSGFPAQKLHFTRKTGRPRRTQHHVSTAAEACAASSSNGQTHSIINTGTPHRMAALHGKQPVPVVRRKEVADSRLSPGVSAGRSETAPGFSTVTHSAGDTISARDTIPQGIPLRRGLHCIGYCSPLLYSASEEAAAGAGYKTRVAFVIIRKGYHRIGCRL